MIYFMLYAVAAFVGGAVSVALDLFLHDRCTWLTSVGIVLSVVLSFLIFRILLPAIIGG